MYAESKFMVCEAFINSFYVRPFSIPLLFSDATVAVQRRQSMFHSENGKIYFVGALLFPFASSLLGLLAFLKHFNSNGKEKTDKMD